MNKVIISTICCACALLASPLAQAQVLKKLKEKTEQLATNALRGGPSIGDQKAADSDAADNMLDSKTVSKDKFGFGGVYYATEIIYGKNKNGDVLPMKKFLVEYNDKDFRLSLSSRHAFKTGTAQVVPLVFGRTDYPFDITIKYTSKFGMPGFMSRYSGGYDHSYYEYQPEDVNSRPYKRGKQELLECASIDPSIFLIEPGILLVGSTSWYQIYHNTGAKDAEKLDNARVKKLFLLYTADKKDKALAYTDAQLHEKANEFAKKYGEVYGNNKEAMNEESAKVIEYTKEEFAKGPPVSFGSSNSNATATKKDVSITLFNKRDTPVKVVIASGKGSKNTFDLNGRTNRTLNVPIGHTISVNGSPVLTVSAGMDGTKQTIAQ